MGFYDNILMLMGELYSCDIFNNQNNYDCISTLVPGLAIGHPPKPHYYNNCSFNKGIIAGVAEVDI